MTVQERPDVVDVRLSKSEKEIWDETLAILSQTLSAAAINTFVLPTRLLSLVDNEATIGVCNDFNMNYLKSRFAGDFKEAISKVVHHPVCVKFVVDTTAAGEVYTPSIASIMVPPEPKPSPLPPQVKSAARLGPAPNAGMGSVAQLNAKYTFESFVVGSHNRFSHSAAFAVAQNPGQAYNPLFIYGGVGLGKTHMMQAIGHEILKNSPSKSVRYLSCERFTNELINSIRDDRMGDFRKRYRQVDVLLVDDIQFIAGKESTQEEFFHTFNALRDSGRQIVLSSDRPPKAISLLEERLRSRFEWGLISDIQAPDLETRMAILRKKCEVENISVPDDVLEYIASLFTNNIRELEGALTRTYALASLTGCALTLQAVSSTLSPATATEKKPLLTIDKIIETVAAHYRVEPSELRSSKRSQDLALPRHIAMYLAHDILQVSFPRIGEAFGKRKHTSALYAFDKIKQNLLADQDLADAVKRIVRQLND